MLDCSLGGSWISIVVLLMLLPVCLFCRAKRVMNCKKILEGLLDGKTGCRMLFYFGEGLEAPSTPDVASA